MKRRAILIGSPSNPDKKNYLSGVKTDVQNMYNFLLSSIGGSWKKEEIKYFFPNEKWINIAPVLQDAESADISFVYFSGHGYRDSTTNRDKVVLNDNEILDVQSDLAMRTNHQITIIDACRSYPQYHRFDGVTTLEGIEFPNPNPDYARYLYDKHLAAIANSKVLLYATEIGANAQDKGSNYGGLFSNVLLQVAKSVIHSKEKPVFSVSEVFTKAKYQVELLQKNQKPVISTINQQQALSLPFAINPKNRLILEMKQQNQNDEIDKFFKALAISAGVVAGIVLIGSLISNKK
jgi:hypothetical protein